MLSHPVISSTQRSALRSRLKICVATWAPFVSGAEIGAERVALGLQQEGHEVFVLAGKRGEVMQRMEKAGLRCIYAPMVLTDKWRFWRYWRARAVLTQLFRRERPDIIHSNDLPTHQMVSEAAVRAGIPRVTYHKFPFSGPALDWMNKFGAELHLFVSQALMEELCAGSQRLRDSRRLVINDGLLMPPEPAESDKRMARTMLNLSADKSIVIFLGQIIERKGVAELLRAWALLPADLRDRAELVLLGDAPQGGEAYRDEMQRLDQELGCRARFAGFQSDVGRWLTASDLMVLPSHADPLPLAIMEAMAYGLPVIGCAVTGIPEMIEHEQTGLLAPPRSPRELAAALTRMLSDAALRQRCGSAGRQRCQDKFSLPAQVRRLESAYRDVLARAGRLPIAG